MDLAIDELEKAAHLDPGALELRLVLGNLYREKGQVGRAIQEHQSLLQRPRLNRVEHANVLLCLGLDYRRGGFVDRAVAAFTDVLKLDPENEAALVNLEKLQEDQHQWQEAYVTRQRLAQIAGPPDQPKSQSILAFLENELGLQALKDGPARRRRAALRGGDRSRSQRSCRRTSTWATCKLQQGDLPAPSRSGSARSTSSPDRAYLALDRLEARLPTARRRAPVRRISAGRLTAAAPREWRARVALARHLTRHGQPREALELLFEALEHNPHALAIHQAIWNTLSLLDLPKPLVARYIEITRESVFYLDPHVCIRCRYRSTELLWQCPHCHEWNTFVEERITPATDTEAEIPPRPRAEPREPASAPGRAHRRHRHREVVLPRSIRARSALRRSTPTCWPATPWRPAVAASTPSSLASAPRCAAPTARSIARRSARIVFADAAARRDLEAIVHPIVYAAIRDWFERLARARADRGRHRGRAAALRDRPRRATSIASSSPPAGRSNSSRALMARNLLSEPTRARGSPARCQSTRKPPAPTTSSIRRGRSSRRTTDRRSVAETHCRARVSTSSSAMSGWLDQELAGAHGAEHGATGSRLDRRLVSRRSAP